MRNPLRKFSTEKKVDAGLLESWKGYSILKRVDEVGGEMLQYTNIKGKKDNVYTGVIPHTIEIHPDILPIPRFYKLIWIRKRWRIRLHKKLFDEPFTRDLYTGEILNQEKKRAVLEEKGFLDHEGFLLDQDGNRVSMHEGDSRMFLKVDVSDIDFIKAETKAVADSKLVVESAKSMAKTGRKIDDNFYIIIGVAFAAIVLVVFIMSGGVEGLGF